MPTFFKAFGDKKIIKNGQYRHGTYLPPGVHRFPFTEASRHFARLLVVETAVYEDLTVIYEGNHPSKSVCIDDFIAQRQYISDFDAPQTLYDGDSYTWNIGSPQRVIGQLFMQHVAGMFSDKVAPVVRVVPRER